MRRGRQCRKEYGEGSGVSRLTIVSPACASSPILFLSQGAQQGLACVQAGGGDAALPSARRTACEELCP